MLFFVVLLVISGKKIDKKNTEFIREVTNSRKQNNVPVMNLSDAEYNRIISELKTKHA
jgi:hypothetical protein